MRLFESDDYPIIDQWFKGWKIPSPPYQYLPKTGFIEDFYAAGFLIQTDTPIAIIEFLIANPDCGPRKRNDAIDAVILTLIEHAKRLGYKKIKGNSRMDSVITRAKKLGFVSKGQFTSLFKEI